MFGDKSWNYYAISLHLVVLFPGRTRTLRCALLEATGSAPAVRLQTVGAQRPGKIYSVLPPRVPAASAWSFCVFSCAWMMEDDVFWFQQQLDPLDQIRWISFCLQDFLLKERQCEGSGSADQLGSIRKSGLKVCESSRCRDAWAASCFIHGSTCFWSVTADLPEAGPPGVQCLWFLMV